MFPSLNFNCLLNHLHSANQDNGGKWALSQDSSSDKEKCKWKAQPDLNNPLRNLSLPTGRNFANKNLFHRQGSLVHKIDEVKTTSSFSVFELTPVIIQKKITLDPLRTKGFTQLDEESSWVAGLQQRSLPVHASKIQVFVNSLLFYVPSSHTTEE